MSTLVNHHEDKDTIFSLSIGFPSENETLFSSTINGPTSLDTTLLVERHCALQDLDEHGIEINIDLERCGIRGFFLQP